MVFKQDGITVTYIYSACIVTSTKDIRILHDPWFTEGVYDGSWYHFPKVENPLESIGDVDVIYVSHIHPDHYDPVFLKQYFEKYGEKRVLIGNHQPNFLQKKMASNGIVTEVLDTPIIVGNTTIEIVPHITGSLSDIDTAIIIHYENDHGTHCVVNANDIIFDAPMRACLKEKTGDIDILLCGYTGAGPYPQTYFDITDPQLEVEATKKKQAFFERYRTLVQELQPKVAIPFAGKYMLGGKLVHLNHVRGVADAVEVLEFDPNAIVLQDNGGTISTADLIPSAVRTELYSERDIHARCQELAACLMDYERLMPDPEEIHQIPIQRLLFSAAKNANGKSELTEDYFFVFSLPDGNRAAINGNKDAPVVCRLLFPDEELPEPRSEIEIDPRYLFGLLTHVYHWNNAEVGSQFNVRRVPNIFNRKAQSYLNFFTL